MFVGRKLHVTGLALVRSCLEPCHACSINQPLLTFCVCLACRTTISYHVSLYVCMQEHFMPFFSDQGYACYAVSMRCQVSFQVRNCILFVIKIPGIQAHGNWEKIFRAEIAHIYSVHPALNSTTVAGSGATVNLQRVCAHRYLHLTPVSPVAPLIFFSWHWVSLVCQKLTL